MRKPKHYIPTIKSLQEDLDAALAEIRQLRKELNASENSRKRLCGKLLLLAASA